MSFVGTPLNHYATATLLRSLENSSHQSFCQHSSLPAAQRLAYLDGELAHSKFILGDHFSAADIMLVYTIANLKALTSELDDAAASYPNVMSYLARLKERPSYKAAYDDEFNAE